jgi:hypothetical protein
VSLRKPAEPTPALWAAHRAESRNPAWLQTVCDLMLCTGTRPAGKLRNRRAFSNHAANHAVQSQDLPDYRQLTEMSAGKEPRQRLPHILEVT